MAEKKDRVILKGMKTERLKDKLLKRSGEKVESAGFAAIKLDIDDELKAVMEERLILVEMSKGSLIMPKGRETSCTTRTPGILWPTTGRSA